MWYCTLIGNDGEVVANLPLLMYTVTVTVVATSIDNTLQNASDVLGPLRTIGYHSAAQCEYNLCMTPIICLL